MPHRCTKKEQNPLKTSPSEFSETSFDSNDLSISSDASRSLPSGKSEPKMPAFEGFGELSEPMCLGTAIRSKKQIRSLQLLDHKRAEAGCPRQRNDLRFVSIHQPRFLPDKKGVRPLALEFAHSMHAKFAGAVIYPFERSDKRPPLFPLASRYPKRVGPLLPLWDGESSTPSFAGLPSCEQHMNKSPKSLTSTSKFLSLVLRHQPEVI